MCDITTDNFESKFQEVSYNLQKANFIGKNAVYALFDINPSPLG